MTDRHSRDRRHFLRTSAASLLGSAITSGVSAQQVARRRGTHLLIRGGTILTMDPVLGDFASGDVLIDGSRIAEIKPQIRSTGDVIDARGMVVIPGLVDAHRHC